MERDGVLAHGMSGFLNESFLVRGDEYYLAICNKTGCISIYNEARNLFLSPYADGPIQFVTNPDNSLNIKNISKFGRSFSILRIPYALKLLLQELQCMNVQMRIITNENIDQLLSMSYSDNLSQLLKEKDPSLSAVINKYTTEVKLVLQNTSNSSTVKYNKPNVDEPELEAIKEKVLSNVVDNDKDLDLLSPGSPPYAPESPPYAPGSAPHIPTSPVSLPYTPTTPTSLPPSSNNDNNEEVKSSILEVDNQIGSNPTSNELNTKINENNDYIDNIDNNNNVNEVKSSNIKVIKIAKDILNK
jgi:hypothetical protein